MKIWYSIFNYRAYTGNEPDFYKSDTFEWTNTLESNWLEIKQELDNHLSANPRLDLTDNNQTVNKHGPWKTMPLITWGVKFHKNINNFPRTTEILKDIPGVVSASFNLLETKSVINQHFGDTNASVRVHLGLHTQKKNSNAGFKVKNTYRPWEEGKTLIFCDGFEHSAWNHSNEDRYILLLDIIKPELIAKKKMICGSVLAQLSFQYFISRKRFWFYLTIIPVSTLHFISKYLAIAFTPIFNSLNRLSAKSF